MEKPEETRERRFEHKVDGKRDQEDHDDVGGIDAEHPGSRVDQRLLQSSVVKVDDQRVNEISAISQLGKRDKACKGQEGVDERPASAGLTRAGVQDHD